MVKETSTLGQRLQTLRQERGFSLRQLSPIVGLKHSYISQLEHGVVVRPSIETIGKLAKGLNVPLDFLLSGEIPTDREDAIKRLGAVSGTSREEVEQIYGLILSLSPENQRAFRAMLAAFVEAQGAEG